jgi:hypothetical protein
MNCIEKMYKEIEEILRKEREEAQKLSVPIREIKHGFSQDASFLTQEEEFVPVDYLSMITLDDEWEKKPFNVIKAKSFIIFIFKKFSCFNKISFNSEKFFENLESKLASEEDLLKVLVDSENEFIELLGGETDEIKAFFTNPYNALFKDEEGYYAVIKNGRYSDVKRPFGFNPNQMKKIIKENLEEYLSDFKNKFKSEKEFNAFSNSVKAFVNKAEGNPNDIDSECNSKLKEVLVKNGVSESAFNAYLEEKGISIIKQGNYYFRKKAYEEYAEYKKIEFRY